MEFESCRVLILAAETIREPFLPLWAMELFASVFLYAWLFCFGASVGSFLNVVVYRLPRGKSLIHPGSLCPQCGHAIRLHDNIPILSWLALGGRCRDCKSPIAPRYLIVELSVAMIFLVIALVETKLTGGFPGRSWDASRWLISPYDTLPFWSAYGLHVMLLTTLLGAALIDRDGFPTPSSLFLPVVITGLLLSAVWPTIFHQAVARGPQAGWSGGFTAGLSGWLAGLATGGIVGWLWSISTGRGWPRFAPVGLFVATGVVLGWQRVLEVAASASLLFSGAIFILQISRAARLVPLAALLLIAALPRLLDLDVRFNMPLQLPENYDGVGAALCLATIGLAAVASGLLAPSQYFISPAVSPTSLEPTQPS